MALSPWPERSTMPVAWPAAIRQLAASLNQSVPETGSLTDDRPFDPTRSACRDGLGQSGEGSSWSPSEKEECTGRSCRKGSRISAASGIGGNPIEECRGSGSRVYKQSPLVVQLRGLFCSRSLVRSARGNHRMNWRFWEKREGYTDTIINALIQAAEGSARNAHATAALESAAGLYQAAFSAAKVEPEQEALGPSFLGEAARRLIRYGQAVYLIEVEDGKIRLRDVASWNIGGGPNEEDWTYSLEMTGPTSSETIKRPSSGVVHLRYAVDPLRPWEGLGPLQSASATGNPHGSTRTASRRGVRGS